MADFSFPGSVQETKEAKVEVEVPVDKPFPVGKMRFRLVVRDDAGNESVPDEVDVYIVDRERPTAILVAPKQVDYGQAFTLDGTMSTDPAGGSIVAYVWTRVE
jgi:hypothetical protein